MESRRTVSVLVVHEEPATRLGTVGLLEGAPHSMASVAFDSFSALGAERTWPDADKVLLLDAAMRDSIYYLRRHTEARSPGAIVVFTAREDAFTIQRCLSAGAHGYVSRRDDTAELIAAIDSAAARRRYVSTRISQVVLETIACGRMLMRENELELLSAREREIFDLIGAGFSTRAIADSLGVAMKTVQTHQHRIKAKLSLKGASELHRRAFAQNQTQGMPA